MISIHALREEGDLLPMFDNISDDISIHALREEGDHVLVCIDHELIISIHALREEGDCKIAQKRAILNVQEG